MGPFHARKSMDPSISVAEDELLLRWLLGPDVVLARAAAIAAPDNELEMLVDHFQARKEWISAAKIRWASARSLMWHGSFVEANTHSQAALSLIAQSLTTDDAEQLVRNCAV